MKLFSLILLIACSAFAADELPVETTPRFLIQHSVTGTSAKLTLRLAANARTRAYPIAANLYCSGGCTATQNKDGGYSGGTVVTPVALTNIAATPEATATHSSTITSGTALPTLAVPANIEYPIGLRDMLMPAGQATAQSYTITLTAGSSMEIRVAIIWAQR